MTGQELDNNTSVVEVLVGMKLAALLQRTRSQALASPESALPTSKETRE